MKNTQGKLTEDQKQEIESFVHNMNTAVVVVSKGQAWIDIDEQGDSVKLSTLNNDKTIAKHAGAIDNMFNEANEKKQMDIKKVQEALDYFGWNIFLIREDNGVSFRGNDRFLLVQITYYMGGMTNKQYAEMYRNAIENNEKVFI